MRFQIKRVILSLNCPHIQIYLTGKENSMPDTLLKIQDSIFNQKLSPRSSFSLHHLRALVSLMVDKYVVEMNRLFPSFSIYAQDNSFYIGFIELIGNGHPDREIRLFYHPYSNTVSVILLQNGKNLTSLIGGGVTLNSDWMSRMAGGFFSRNGSVNRVDDMFDFFLACLRQLFSFHIYDVICKKVYTLSEFLNPVKRTLLSVPNRVDMDGIRNKDVVSDENVLGELTKNVRMFGNDLRVTVLA